MSVAAFPKKNDWIAEGGQKVERVAWVEAYKAVVNCFRCTRERSRAGFHDVACTGMELNRLGGALTE